MLGKCRDFTGATLRGEEKVQAWSKDQGTCVIRIDGQPLWNNSLTPYKGTDTVSPFVAVS